MSYSINFLAYYYLTLAGVKIQVWSYPIISSAEAKPKINSIKPFENVFAEHSKTPLAQVPSQLNFIR